MLRIELNVAEKHQGRHCDRGLNVPIEQKSNGRMISVSLDMSEALAKSILEGVLGRAWDV